MRKSILATSVLPCLNLLAACGEKDQESVSPVVSEEPKLSEPEVVETSDRSASVTPGTDEYRGFSVDNILHSESLGDIYFNLYVPDSYEGSEAYALFITLPGYQGLYFQGVAQNIKTENFGFEAQKYNDRMLIVAPQLEDWGETSADKTIGLTEYFLNEYNIDAEKVYLDGYSGGGETLSLVLDKRADLYMAALMCSSQWDGGYETAVKNKTPIYFAIGESDEYYGSAPFKTAYQALCAL